MTILQKAATIAAMSLSLVGLAGTSSAVRAMDIEHKVFPAPIAAMNTLAMPLVPGAAIAGSVSSQTIPDVAPATTAAAAAVQDDGNTRPAPEFASLADAVAAQDAIAQSDDLRCLAGAIYFESKGEPLSGQLGVAQVILNRVKSGRFPTDVCSVVKQRGQFSFVRGGEIPTIDAARSTYRTAIAVAEVALAKAWQNGSVAQALFFNATGRSPGHAQRIAAIGGHTFYR